MPIDLATLVAPAHTALVTQEIQNGVIGEPAVFPQLAEIARASGMIAACGRLAAAARGAAVPVLHSVAVRRKDGKGSNDNARVFAAARRSPVSLEPGSEGARVIAEIGEAPEDFVLHRHHGLGPFAGTDLDAILTNLGVRTVVGIGVSVNVGVTNLVMDAVNLGYQVVVPRDAVAGVPAEYGDQVIENTLSYLATVTTTDEILRAWEGAA